MLKTGSRGCGCQPPASTQDPTEEGSLTRPREPYLSALAAQLFDEEDSGEPLPKDMTIGKDSEVAHIEPVHRGHHASPHDVRDRSHGGSG